MATILAVDDDHHTLTLIAYNLQHAGFGVVTATNGAQGLEILRHTRVDLVLCDIMMPGIDGFAFWERLRMDPQTQHLPFVFLTAKAQPCDEVRGLTLGVDEYITKPFDPQVLIARVQAVLERRKTFELMTRHDALTGLLNRPTLEHDVHRELTRLQRYGAIGCLAFIDLDNFKHINDTCGHQTGDRVLSRFGRLVAANTRDVDIAGRYGGEEFLVCFPETPAQNAAAVLERIQALFAAIDWGSRPVSTSFSAGLAEFPRDGSDFDTLCRRADQTMYLAKQSGKATLLIRQAAAHHGPAGD